MIILCCDTSHPVDSNSILKKKEKQIRLDNNLRYYKRPKRIIKLSAWKHLPAIYYQPMYNIVPVSSVPRLSPQSLLGQGSLYAIDCMYIKFYGS